MLKQLRLKNFRAFRDFSLSFKEGAYLVGPNNAGKSTLLTAIRTADALMRYAHRRSADLQRDHDGRNVRAYPVSLNDFPALRDSLRHEFGSEEAVLQLTWTSGARLTAVWPDEGVEIPPFFYLEKQEGMQIWSASDARTYFPLLGVIPILSPVEHTELVLQDAYVRQNITGRLTSRHFRNHLRALRNAGQLDEWVEWATPWLPDLQFDSLDENYSSDGIELHAYFYEAGSRVPKELVWTGDGIQIWLQILFHIYRVKDQDTIVLDEPEVYLHPDLQRKLVHLLESTGRQVVVATHSSEVVSEAEKSLITTVDKSKRTAHRATKAADLEALSALLGTAFNLRLARALRSKSVLFVEGKDMAILRRLARVLSLDRLQLEQGVTIIPLEGFSNWTHIEPFVWLVKNMLPDAVKVHVFLDRDYRSDEQILGVERDLQGVGVQAHVWRRKELESYLLVPSLIARTSGAGVEDVDRWLSEITADMEAEVFGRLLGERSANKKVSSEHAVSIFSSFKSEFDPLWDQSDYRLRSCPPKQIISKLNSKLQVVDGLRTISASQLARNCRVGEIDSEMAAALKSVEQEL